MLKDDTKNIYLFYDATMKFYISIKCAMVNRISDERKNSKFDKKDIIWKQKLKNSQHLK